MEKLHHGASTYQTRVVQEFSAGDLGAPFGVVLVGSVTEAYDPSSGEQVSYTIPDPDGLVRAVIFARILHDRKLNGPEIKWLRKAAGIKQKEIAHAISMTPEHLSRCEAGGIAMSPASEKLLRLYLFKMAIKHHKIKECEAKAKLEAALDRLFDVLEPVAAYAAGESLVFHFSRRQSFHGAGNDNVDDCDDGWDGLKLVNG